MHRPRRFKEFLTGLGLLILAAGFTALGFLSLIKRHPEDGATGIFSEDTYSIVGSTFSILVGAIFLLSAVLFVGTLVRGRTSFSPE
jgi:hypothetical protein